MSLITRSICPWRRNSAPSVLFFPASGHSNAYQFYRGCFYHPPHHSYASLVIRNVARGHTGLPDCGKLPAVMAQQISGTFYRVEQTREFSQYPPSSQPKGPPTPKPDACRNTNGKRGSSGTPSYALMHALCGSVTRVLEAGTAETQTPASKTERKTTAGHRTQPRVSKGVNSPVVFYQGTMRANRITRRGRVFADTLMCSWLTEEGICSISMKAASRQRV